MVKRQTVSARSRSVVMAVWAVLLFLGGCAASEMGGTSAPPTGTERRAVPRVISETTSDTLSRQMPYDLEDEMPEKTPPRPAQLVEKLVPVKPDTFNVQDIEVEQTPKQPAPKQMYDIGYRIQVFASSDKTAAENIKQRVGAETGMPVYLEFEEGLYKVRAGDFAERKDAAQARLRLVGVYPGSWIVRTTIRKTN